MSRTTLYDVDGAVIADNLPFESAGVGGLIEHDGKQYMTLAIQGMGWWHITVMPWSEARILVLDAQNGKEIAKIAYPLDPPRVGHTLTIDGRVYAVEVAPSMVRYEDGYNSVLYARER